MTVTWSPIDRHSDIVLSNGNLTVGTTSTAYKGVKASEQSKEAKYYFEVKIDSLSNRMLIGLANESVNTSASYGANAGGIPVGVKGLMNTGIIYNGSNTVNGGAYVVGDVIGVSFDSLLGVLNFYKNGVNIHAISGLNVSENWLPYAISYQSGDMFTVNFGATTFAYSVPNGYKPYQPLNKTLIQSTNGEYKKYDEGSPAIYSGNVIPTMTNNTTPSGRAFAKNVFSSGDNEPYKAFNSFDDTSGYNSLSGSGGVGYLGYEFDDKKTIGKYAVRSGSTPSTMNRYPKTWTFEGSDDGSAWMVLDTQTGHAWTPLENKEFTIKNPSLFKMYRLNWTENNGESYTAINELEMYEPKTPATPPSWQTISISNPPTKADFETHGIDDLSTIPESAWQDLYNQSPKVKFVTYVPDGNTVDNIESTTMGKELSMSALPTPQFIKQVDANNINGEISDFLATETYEGSENGVIRYLLSPDKSTWKSWSGTDFISVNTSNNIAEDGMDRDTLQSLTVTDWKKWSSQSLYLGIYLEEDIKDKTKAHIDSISYKDLSPKESTQISDAKLYILNTVSTIDVEFKGSTITGSVDDEDEGKVQYRIILNGKNYFPTDGSFTPLMASPLDIDLTLSNKDYKIDENNTLRIEFKDYWGTVDYWETQFIGQYSGILFTDTAGDYYSTDIGEVLKYLDFGVIIAGQTTTEHEIKLKNTYGYAIENIKLYTKANSLPSGMQAQFGTNLISFEAAEELSMNTVLDDGEEVSFYIRLSTQLGVTPPTMGEFDIVVVADKV